MEVATNRLHTGIVLVPCRAWKCVPTTISRSLDISEVLWCHFLRQMSSQLESQKLLHGIISREFTAYLSHFDLFLIE